MHMVHEDIEYQIIDKSKFTNPPGQKPRFLDRFLAPRTCHLCGDTLAVRVVTYPMLGGVQNLKEYRYCRRCRIGYLKRDDLIQPQRNQSVQGLPGS